MYCELLDLRRGVNRVSAHGGLYMVRRLNFTFKTTITPKALKRKKENRFGFSEDHYSNGAKLGQREWNPWAAVSWAGRKSPKKARKVVEREDQSHVERGLFKCHTLHDLTN